MYSYNCRLTGQSCYVSHVDVFEPACSRVTLFLYTLSQVLIFDFGTEVYAWCGKLASMELRKTGLKLARVLFQAGYDYTDYDINPMSPLTRKLSCLISSMCAYNCVVLVNYSFSVL